MTPEDLTQALRNFTGTTQYTRWSPLFRNFVLTDGALYLAENAGAYWLMDLIASHVGSYQNEPFVVAKLTKKNRVWRVSIEDGNDAILASQKIGFSDFPLDEMTLYVIQQPMDQGDVWVILLPSEY